MGHLSATGATANEALERVIEAKARLRKRPGSAFSARIESP